MPGLPYENLPAQQQQPMNILKGRYDKTEQYLKSQYDNELGAIKNQMLSDKDFYGQLNELNSKYKGQINQERYKADQQVQSIKRIESLVDSGQINLDAGQEAIWRIVLPSETERAMFQAAEKPQQPYSISQITSTSVMQSISDFAEAAPGKSGMEWGKPEKLQQGLMNQYAEWRNLIAYDTLNPIQQRQLDMQWDAFMAGDKKFDKWWADKKKNQPLAEIRAMRTPGKIGKIMGQRLGVNLNTTPLGQSIVKARPRFTSVTPFGIQPAPEASVAGRARQAKELRKAGTKEAYEKGVKLGYWE